MTSKQIKKKIWLQLEHPSFQQVVKRQSRPNYLLKIKTEKWLRVCTLQRKRAVSLWP